MNLSAAPREELITAILRLRDENSYLKHQLNLLRRRLEQLQKKTPTDHPPPHFKPNAPETPPGERRKRIVNFGRKRDVPDRIVNHAYQRCPDCGAKLYGGWLKSRRQIIDLPLPAVTVTEHQVFEHWCSACHKKVSPRLDLADAVLGNHRVSFRLMSLIATLREQCRLPLGVIRGYLKMFHQLKLSEGEITAVLNTVAGLAGPVHRRLKQEIRGSPVVHGDETGWRQNGRNGYLWSFSTPAVKYLLYRKSRGRQVVREAIGDEFEGVLVSDFYGGYNVHQGYHQRCWAHLLRDINKLIADYPDHYQLKQWTADVTSVFQTAKDYPGPDPRRHPTPRAQKQQRVRDSREFADRLMSVCQPYLVEQTPMTTLCKRIDKYIDELFLFVTDPAVPSDNNPAERALRHSVISRKISGGTRSARGSNTKMVLASLFGTWRLQQKNPFQECLNLLEAVSAARPAVETVSGE